MPEGFDPQLYLTIKRISAAIAGGLPYSPNFDAGDLAAPATSQLIAQTNFWDHPGGQRDKLYERAYRETTGSDYTTASVYIARAVDGVDKAAIKFTGADGITFQTGGNNDRVLIDNAGHLRPQTDNIYDLGISTSMRWRTLYAVDVDANVGRFAGGLAVGANFAPGSNRIEVRGSTPDITIFEADALINGAVFQGKKSRGTHASPAGILSGDEIFRLAAIGYDTASFEIGAEVLFQAAATWSTTNRGTEALFRTRTTASSAVLSTKVKIDGSGHLLPGADNTYDNGASGSRWKTAYAVDVEANVGRFLGGLAVGANFAPGSNRIEVRGSTPDITVFEADALVNGAVFQGKKSRGTHASPAGITSGDEILRVTATGYDTASFETGGEILFQAAATWSTTNRGTEIIFRTRTTTASAVLGPKLTINGSGDVDIAGRVQVGGDTNFYLDVAVAGAGLPGATFDSGGDRLYYSRPLDVFGFQIGGSTYAAVYSTGIEVTDGTVSLPAWRFLNDTDTGIYRSAANELAFSCAGALKTLVDASGLRVPDGLMVGANTAPAAKTIELRGSTPSITIFEADALINGAVFQGKKSRGSHASPTGVSSGDEILRIAALGHDTSTFEIGGEIEFQAAATWSTTNRGTKVFFRTRSTAASAALSPKLVIDENNIGIGTTVPADLLHIEDTDATVSATQLTLEGRFNGWGAGINFVSRTSSGGTRVSMAKITADGEAPWDTVAANQDAGLRFFTALDGALAERMRLTSGGLLRGADGSATTPFYSFLNDSDSGMYYTGAANVIGWATGGTARVLLDTDFRPATDNTPNLGTASFRWKEVFAAIGTINTSDAREKQDVIDSPLGLDFVRRLRPVSFGWIAHPEAGRRYGLIAQEVREALHGEPFGGLYDDGKSPMGLAYSELIAPLVRAVQEQDAEIRSLRAEVERLRRLN